ncbi:hypothetical protein NECAME_14197 [Necator americanus]|uniref:SSD domain-containing protein n=1 Tax=Necator americanus TaxID=51031 RepID=W2SP97_NECAM|nr:hypothetical protein NECAME_14197 [Necator americanus]ETN71470.1 hypothetical protein NECAME_14197 [Necator americanus]
MAKDGGSMHRKEYFDEAENIVNYMYNLTVKTNERSVSYNKMCKPYCMSSKKLLMAFKKYFDINYKSAVKNQYYSDLYNLSYPFGTIWGIRIPLEKALFGVRLTEKEEEPPEPKKNARGKRFFGNNIPIDPNKTIESQITNMEHVTLMLFVLYGNKNTPLNVTDFSQWELGMYEWSKEYNEGKLANDSLVKILMFGTDVLDMEINTANTKLAPYFGAGFASMIGFVALCVFSSAYYYNTLDLGKILVGIGATLCPLLAITCTYGILSMLGFRINSLLFVMPFLIMGVGVDAAFLMINSWQKLKHNGNSHVERLVYKNLHLQYLTKTGLVYEDVGPSITITSVTNVLSFVIGAITPTPVWAEFLAPTFYVNVRFNMTNDSLTTQFWDMLKGLEELPRCRGHRSSYIWFRDFVQKNNKTKEIYPYKVGEENKELRLDNNATVLIYKSYLK